MCSSDGRIYGLALLGNICLLPHFNQHYIVSGYRLIVFGCIHASQNIKTTRLIVLHDDYLLNNEGILNDAR